MKVRHTINREGAKSAKNFAKQNSFQESKDFRFSSTGNSRMKRLVAILAGLPLYALLALYLYVIGWRAHLGYWPRYGRPDAGALHGLVLVPDVAVGILLATGVLSCLIFLPAALALLSSGRFVWLREPVLFWALAWTAFLLLLYFDPGSFLDWYLD